VTKPHWQTGRQKNWPSDWNEKMRLAVKKIKLKKVLRNESKQNKLSWKMENQELEIAEE